MLAKIDQDLGDTCDSPKQAANLYVTGGRTNNREQLESLLLALLGDYKLVYQLRGSMQACYATT
jgi:hypothetical protein